jgi:hypothetical protein
MTFDSFLVYPVNELKASGSGTIPQVCPPDVRRRAVAVVALFLLTLAVVSSKLEGA